MKQHDNIMHGLAVFKFALNATMTLIVCITQCCGRAGGQFPARPSSSPSRRVPPRLADEQLQAWISDIELAIWGASEHLKIGRCIHLDACPVKLCSPGHPAWSRLCYFKPRQTVRCDLTTNLLGCYFWFLQFRARILLVCHCMPMPFGVHMLLGFVSPLLQKK